MKLTSSTASHYAQLVLKSIHREYPHKLDHLVNEASQVQTPRELHPAFYGCFDWHSSVHGHWLLARLLRLFSDLPEAQAMRRALDESLTRENIEVEAAYFKAPGRQSFERTYGWAWLLKLDEELGLSNEPDSIRMRGNLGPLVDIIVARYMEFLPKQNYPIRTGVHPNTAFGISFALDYARSTDNSFLQALLVERSLAYYFADENYPADWEPGGEDFLSPALIEADLMRRVLPQDEFASWFARFLPELNSAEAGSRLLQPAVVPDRTDPKMVHLDGLNLSKAWCLEAIANALTGNSRELVLASAQLHANAALPHMASGDYVGEHWLATFAVYLLTN